METSKITPDVIDSLPAQILEITYGNDIKVQLGNELTPTQVKDVPQVAWNAAPDSLYTLLMTDPDAPSRQMPLAREVRHWLVVNIPGNNIGEGQTIYEYVGAGPPEKSGLHRYVFLVFKQHESIVNITAVSKSSSRLRTKTRDLIKAHNLGKPIAGNFFVAQYDEYVPILDKQMGWAPPTVVKMMLSGLNFFQSSKKK